MFESNIYFFSIKFFIQNTSNTWGRQLLQPKQIAKCFEWSSQFLATTQSAVSADELPCPNSRRSCSNRPIGQWAQLRVKFCALLASTMANTMNAPTTISTFCLNFRILSPETSSILAAKVCSLSGSQPPACRPPLNNRIHLQIQNLLFYLKLKGHFSFFSTHYTYNLMSFI